MTRTRLYVLMALCAMLAVFTGNAVAAQIETVEPKPLKELVNVRLQPVQPGPTRVGVITWGGDVATILASLEGTFKNEGLSIELFCENDLVKQTQALLDGKTPYLRGTMAQVLAAAEVLKAAGTDMVVVVQLTWSKGGDAITVRDKIKTPMDLEGGTIALQLYGPHMDFAPTVLANAGIRASQVKFKWFKELTIPTYETNGKIVDPVTAFQASSDIDAVMCIIPDAMNLTSKGDLGVKGASILMSTATGSRITADVYGVRKDYFDANRDKVQAFVHATLRAQEALADLRANKASQQTRYQQLLARSAEILMGAPQATADVEGLLDGCEFVGYDGNVAFFTGKGTTRSFKTLTGEMQTALTDLGLIKTHPQLATASWDYASLASGLKNVGVTVTKPALDQAKVAAKVEAMIKAEPTEWEQKGTLFVKEIYFGPDQSTFDESQYAADFEVALRKWETNKGALVVIEGHADPLGILKAKQKGVNQAEVALMEQRVKNLSLERAEAARDSFIKYCKDKGIDVDVSKFQPAGLGIAIPKFNPPRTEEEWAQNRRVVFRLKNIEAELSEFEPLK